MPVAGGTGLGRNPICHPLPARLSLLQLVDLLADSGSSIGLGVLACFVMRRAMLVFFPSSNEFLEYTRRLFSTAYWEFQKSFCQAAVAEELEEEHGELAPARLVSFLLCHRAQLREILWLHPVLRLVSPSSECLFLVIVRKYEALAPRSTRILSLKEPVNVLLTLLVCRGE